MQPSTSIFPLDSAVLEDSPHISASSASDTTNAQPDFTSKTSQEIIDLVQQIYGFSPRPYQIKSLRSLQVDRRDTILYAPTGTGKSLITQVYPLLDPGWVLCIVPLTRLGDEQVAKITSLSGLRGFLLHDKSNTAEQRAMLRDALTTGQCTHRESPILRLSALPTS